MSDKIKGLVVALDGDYGEQEVKEIINAIYMIRGVVGVQPELTTGNDFMNRSLIALEIQQAVFKAVREITKI